MLEHSVFTFGVDGISRNCSHQLVRHRIASYSQQSFRYTKLDNEKDLDTLFVLPPNRHKDLYRDIYLKCLGIYSYLIDKGIPAEDARYVLPSSVKSNIVITMNARELLHFFTLRCCERAQWEIREMANEMLKLAKDVSPLIFKNAGPNCIRNECKETHTCPKKND